MFSRIIKFIFLLHYIFSEKYYSRRDGFYIQLSTKYHQISKEFFLYYMERGQYICCFEGNIRNGNFELNLDEPKSFGNQSRYLLRGLDLSLIKKRITEYIIKYHSDIKIRINE